MMKAFYPLNYFDMNGIIRQNPNLNVSAMASKEYDKNRAASNVLNSETGIRCWHSGDVAKSDIQIYFNTSYIYLTNYSIQTPDLPDCTTNGHFPKQWKLYGFDDSKWKELSEVNESGLTTKLKIQVFNIRKDKQGVYNRFKFESDSVDYYGDKESYSFVIQAIDFWGTLCSSKTNCRYISYHNEQCSNNMYASIFNIGLISFIFIIIYNNSYENPLLHI